MRTQTYRTELEIISTILEIMMNVGMSGEYVTTIVRNANLSHTVAMDKIDKLINANLIRASEKEFLLLPKME